MHKLNKNRILLSALFMGTLVSCSSKKEGTSEDIADDSNEELSLEDIIGEDDSDFSDAVDENFDDFFYTFTHKTSFQLNRIKYPLPVIHNGQKERVISSGRAFQEEFNMPSEDFYTVFYTNPDQMEFGLDANSTNARFDLIDFPNRTIKSFYFQRPEREWILVEEELIGMDHHPLGDFLSFYERFATDTLYQETALADIINITMPDPDDETEIMEGFIDPEQWSVFRPELPHGVLTNIDYGQDYRGAEQIIMMQSGMSNGLMEIYSFIKSNGSWKLSGYEQ